MHCCGDVYIVRGLGTLLRSCVYYWDVICILEGCIHYWGVAYIAKRLVYLVGDIIYIIGGSLDCRRMYTLGWYNKVHLVGGVVCIAGRLYILLRFSALLGFTHIVGSHTHFWRACVAC